MKVNKENFLKNVRKILNLTHNPKYVSSLDEEDALSRTEVVWVKSLIDLGYSVTFKNEGVKMDNKNNESIWSPQQEKVINDLHKKIDDNHIAVNKKIDDGLAAVNKKIDDNHIEVTNKIDLLASAIKELTVSLTKHINDHNK